MSILTKNQVPAKGQAAEFQLDKSALAAVASVMADSYFGNTSNWKSVDMIFKSNPGKQRVIVNFDASQAMPLGYFKPSAKSRNVFDIEKIVINDFDGGEFVIKSSELNLSEFHIDMTPSPAGTYVTWDALSSGYTTLSNGGIEKLSYNTGDDLSKSSQALTGDFELKYTFNYADSTAYNYFTIGICNSPVIPNNGSMNVMLLAYVGGWGLYSQGPQVNLSSIYFNQSGQNIISFKRTGSSLQIIINDVVVGTPTVTSGNVYPAVRLAGRVISTLIV